MPVEVKIPELGESITEAVIARWIKSDGDAVAVDEILCELETDKASVELPSPAAGKLSLRAKEGDTVNVGDTIAEIDESAAGDEPEPEKPERSEKKAAPAAGESASPPPEPQAAPEKTRDAQAAGERRAGPAAKRLLEEHGVDPQTVEATGPGKRITKEDVVRTIERGDRPSPAESSEAPKPAGTRPAGDGEERVRMSRLRQTIATRLVEAQQSAAILTTFNEIDMSAVMSLRRRYKEKFAETHGVSLGFMSFFSRACVQAAADVPEVNARIEGDEIVYNRRVHLGIAASTERGLVVPVVRDAQDMSFADLEREIGRLAAAARDNKLSLDDLSGGTFTISNGGVFGSLMSTPILNPPQSGILGMHKIEKRPVVVDDEIVVRPMMYVALSYDHRIVDGKGAVTFLVRVKERIEDPERLLLEL